MKKQNTKSELVIYKDKKGNIEFLADASGETIWATQADIARVFSTERSVITKHIRNIFKDKELDGKAVCANFAHTASDGKTYKVEHYNLDVVISVGYRVNSKTATHFRQWATKTLRSYILDGFAINRKRISANYTQFLGVVEDIKKLLPAAEGTIGTGDVVELVSLFADTWLSLDAYDRDQLVKGKLTKKKVSLTTDKINNGLTQLKSELLKKSEATDIFGQERSSGSVSGIVGNVMQSFGGKELYETVEEKAAHLLYFMVKNHPFVDGNKRSGAFAFVWFLRQANLLDVSKITPSALTALTILVASSDPKEKEKIVGLILSLISKK
jgi:prophage maintenance system killer protein